MNRPRTATEIVNPAIPTRADGGLCREVNDIVIDGAISLSDGASQKITSPYVGKCMTVGDIELVLSELVKYYVDKGYVAARAYLQPQDLANGILRILVIEGVIEKIKLEDESGNRNVNLTTAFPGATGDPFNLREFEQGLDQINRLPSNNAIMDIEPGDNPGGSVIVIRNKPSRRFRGTPSFDNYGSTSTGEAQMGLSLSVDNPLALNDSFNYSHRRTTGGDIGSQHSRSHSFLYSVPLGHLTVTASHNRSDYATTIRPVGGDLIANGNSRTTSLSTEYVTYRDAINRVSLSGTLSAKTYNNFLSGQFLDVSSRKISTFDLRGSWNTRVLDGAFGLNFNYVRGLRIFDALDDPTDLPDDLPHAQFNKIMFGASWLKPFQIGLQNFTFSSSFSAQVGIDVLFGSEQFFIGNVYSVRGFRNSSIAGDTGYFLRNDLGMPIVLQAAGVNFVVKPYIGYDFGNVWDRNELSGGHLMGMTAGMRASASRISIDIVGVKPVSLPSGFEDEGFQFFVKVSVNL